MTPVLAFLGCGSMNGSILRGVLASGVPVEQVRATVRSAESARRLEDETAWIEQQRRMWDARFDELEQVVAERRRKEQVDGHPKRR